VWKAINASNQVNRRIDTVTLDWLCMGRRLGRYALMHAGNQDISLPATWAAAAAAVVIAIAETSAFEQVGMAC